MSTAATSSKRQWTRWAGVLALATALLGACGSASTTSGTAPPSKSAYKVGVIADLTGPAATLGAPQIAGVRAWADAVNSSGGIHGHRVVLSSCDAGGTSQGGVTCASKMTGLPVVIDTSLIGSVVAALPSLTHSLVFATTPLLLPTKTKDPNAFQTEPTIGVTDSVMLAGAQRNGIHTVGIVATDDATGTVAVKALQAESSRYNVSLQVQYVPENLTDATVQVTQLNADHVGMVFVAAPGAPAAAVLRAYKNLAMSQPLVLTSADVTNAFLASVTSLHVTHFYGAPATGAIVTTSLTQPYKSDTQAFFNQYSKSTGKAVDYPTLLGYYTGQLAGDVIGSIGYSATLPAMEHYVDTQPLPTLIGQLRFDNAPSNVESGANPALVEVNSSGTAWGPCTSSARFQC